MAAMTSLADPARVARAQRAAALAETLLREALAGQTSDQVAQAHRLARMMDDPNGKALTIALTDQAFRSRRPERIADQIASLLDRYGTPRFMEWWERVGLILGGVMGRYLPSLVVPPILHRLREEAESFVLPAEEEDLARYLAERRAAGIRLNLNQLGEAILGEEEAARRLAAYLALLARDDVEYISVKVSSVSSQINLVAFRATIDVVKERLRALYRQALSHRYTHPDGRVTPKFVNLDMEEYRDLDLTVTAFREVLDEDEFLSLPAGIVLQAYLPDSHRAQRALTEWAIGRCARGGAPIKLRIVKGANLAMERIEAELSGWPQAPYATKPEVDANYKRMLEYGCDPARARAVHLGVASHNLFDLAHGLVLREERGVLPWLEFEMLEGMADHQARVVQAYAGGLLLYAPVVRAEDFTSAIAYLVRRLDENTAEDNFLRHVFGLEPGSPEWARERERFLSAFTLIDSVSDAPRRTQDRAAETRTELDADAPDESAGRRPPHRAVVASSRGARGHEHDRPGAGDPSSPFVNEPDTDWSIDANRRWIAEVMARWRDRAPESVPLQIGGELIARDEVDGRDRSRPGRIAYRHAVADRALVSRALDAARAALPAWASRSLDERRAILDRAAAVLASRRDDLIGAMIVDGAKTIAEADPEVSEAIDFARYYARAFYHVGDLAECHMQPLGVVVVAPPWNFPLSIPAGGVLAALAAGNVAILKPAPEAVLVGWHLAQALWDAGIPRDALAFLPSPDGDVGRGLITDPRADAVILTGSVETARRFLAWRPDLPLFAETSGKNAMIVTALSDRDQAIRDLVRSAFGHNGQKCSAASLAICEAEVYDDAVFRRQLRDAAASLRVGSAWDASSRVTPLTQAPGEALSRALTTLDEGEEWLLAPRPLDADGLLWSPGIKLGVRRGSFFHVTECFGPVLGLMRAEHLDDAIDLANGTPFGLTSGIQSLDDREIERWIDRIEAGNLYVNRPITGAIVGRQPFGGWKDSSVGPGAKAGGPNYVLQLARWEQISLPRADDHMAGGADSLSRGDGSTGGAEVVPGADSMPLGAESTPRVAALIADCVACVEGDAAAAATLRASAASYATAWREHFARGHDPSALRGEENVFRYRPCRGIAVRADPSVPAQRTALLQVILAALTAGVPLVVSLAGGDVWPWLTAHFRVTVTVETEAELIDRLRARDVERLRVVGSIGTDVRTAANESGVTVIDAQVLATGRLELRWYLREQTVTRVRHRYGNVIEPAGTE